ncbi:hypothetical protein [uncultured Lacinutrix sp.]|uniref:hypothetical protein n=1 Tax=uncultured Lacinutrix sp. TaxID=574032 RepID=UPI00262F4FB5|nr:hypothetical protein [uncultured Lacinutrix sp.]
MSLKTRNGIAIISALIVISWVIFLIYQLFLSIKFDKTTSESRKFKAKEITKIAEGTALNSAYNVIHHEYYHIMHSHENGLNLDSLEVKVLNKTVTLHLPRILGSKITSEHITQIIKST